MKRKRVADTRVRDILIFLHNADNNQLKTDKRVLLKITKAVINKGITLVDFATKLGYSDDSGMGGLMLKGRRKITVNNLIKIAQILEVDLTSILPDEMCKSKITFEEYIEKLIEEKVKNECLKKP